MRGTPLTTQYQLMLIKTRGIVLSHIRYRETSIIARVYTERLGLQSYLVNGVRKAKPPGRIALFQPLTLLELRKSSIGLLLSEIVSRVLLEEEENEPLFTFLHDSILAFDRQAAGFENFALVFLLQLSHYLGFGPEKGAEVTSQVAFATDVPGAASAPTVLRFREFDAYFDALMRTPDTAVLPNGRVRRELLGVLIRYYQLHVERLGDIRSLAVLSEVLAEL